MAKRPDLFDPTDPARLQPEQRLTEAVAIAAASAIRMTQRVPRFQYTGTVRRDLQPLGADS